MCVSSNLFEKLLRVQRKREGGLSQICCGKLSVLIMCPSPREVRCSNTEFEKIKSLYHQKKPLPKIQ